MFKDIFKRLTIQIIVYIIIFYLIPYIGTICNETTQLYLTAIFLVVLNILFCITISCVDTYKYKLNYFLWILPGILFIPTIRLFNFDNLYIYSLIYSASYGIGMLLGWSYKTYGYQLKTKKNKNQ